MTATRERSTNMLQEAFHTRKHTSRACHPLGGTLNRPWACAVLYRLLGKLNTAPSRTPALGQRWVMVLRLV